MDISKCIEKKVFDQIFLDHSVKIKVFLRGSKTAGDQFDPFRKTGGSEETQNPIFVDAMTKSVSPNSLIIREMGLTESGALQIIVKCNDLSVIKLSKRIVINNIEYYIFNDAVGSKLQIFEAPFKYKRIIIFRKDV